MTSTEQTSTGPVVPDMPEALEKSERRAARTLKSTVRDALDVMREVLPIMLAFRGGEQRIAEAILTADSPACLAYRQAREEQEKRDKAADEEYAAAIKPFQEARDAAKAETAKTVATYEGPAREEVAATVGGIPTVEENTEALSDWTASVQQIRNAQQNAKRQLNLEFSVSIPSLPGAKGQTNNADDPYAWRPRFSAVTLDGEELGDEENPPTSGDVFAALNITRIAFMKSFNRALGGDDIAKSKWDAMDPGDTLSVQFVVNDQPHPALFTKAEPITRGAKSAAPAETAASE